MADLNTKIEVELENIDRILAEFPENIDLFSLSTLELAGVATLIHNFYNGIENIIKQIILTKNIHIPQGDSWHKDLIDLANKNGIISGSTKESLGEYLAFRHFFSHAYALELNPDRMVPLVINIKEVYGIFRKDINFL